jgi:glycosyltransferase involved in cell wall biosynthesis
MNDPTASTEARGPLRTLFVITSMPVGGAETLLVNLIRRLDRAQFAPEVCCLKEPGPLGEVLADEIPVHSRLLSCKYDLRVLPRLTRLMRRRKIDAVVTVGAGDKMFWGRLAARAAGAPVVASALHSTGWPDGVGRLNRRLTGWTDAFIAVAREHGEFLVDFEHFPRDKVRVIPNGVDLQRFQKTPDGRLLRAELNIPTSVPLIGTVAALRPEKNQQLLLRAAQLVRHKVPQTHVLIVGDGPERPALESLARELGIAPVVHFAGTRSDVPELLSLLDVFVLTSHNEANPVSILEAMAVGKPVVSTDVGSIRESVQEGRTGFLVEPGDCDAVAHRAAELLLNPLAAHSMGAAGRAEVADAWSLEAMVQGYENLIREIYERKCGAVVAPRTPSQIPATARA